MLFSSHEFIFIFLPLVLLGYFLLNRVKIAWLSRAWLVASCLFFYGWFNPAYLVLIISSIVINFGIGRLLGKSDSPMRRLLLWAGIAFNIGLLGYYKYYDFFIGNLNLVLGTEWTLRHLLLPLGISFFTFQQVSFLVDSYRRPDATRYTPLNYSLFVLFFPQLIAGPIVLHHEMMPQFDAPKHAKPNFLNLSAGLHLFAVGLCKKVVFADTFADWATNGFDVLPSLTFWQAWVAAIAYTFQIYFDFSGYCDMAMGIGRMFNIHLPANFNSPYRSRNIKEFWTRWHMTLGRFLSHYVYIPLGGNRLGQTRTYLNLLATFLISGLWHGAGWTFVIWGGLHGVAMAAHRFWNNCGWRMNRKLGRAITLLFVICAWVLFRADSMADALKVYRGMFASADFGWRRIDDIISAGISASGARSWLLLAFFIVLVCKNAMVKSHTFRPTVKNAMATILLLVVSLLYMSRISPFIYYNF
jgi:D-alanyl-lipoteichoic acid acyltransferase DltB (MBOAT superfamily)